jgi:hypothetical protein
LGIFSVTEATEYGDAPRKEPKCYPGERPDFSFLLHERKVHELRVFGKVWDSQLTWGDGTRVLQDVLNGLGLGSIEPWYCVLAYGSNGCPPQLVHKGFKTIVVVKCRLFDILPVYAGYKSEESGYIPGTLARSKGTEVESWVTIMQPKDLKRMDRSEGRPETYELVEVNEGKLFLENGKEIRPIYAYVTTEEKGLFLHHGKLVPLFEVKQKKALEWHSKDKLRHSETNLWLDRTPIAGKPPKVFGDLI